MVCPRCQGPLDEREREGVTIDVCRSCRGVFLDRGELEKIIARSRDEHDEERRYYHEHRREHDDDDYDKYRGRYRKKGLMERFGDIFD